MDARPKPEMDGSLGEAAGVPGALDGGTAGVKLADETAEGATALAEAPGSMGTPSREKVSQLNASATVTPAASTTAALLISATAPDFMPPSPPELCSVPWAGSCHS